LTEQAGRNHAQTYDVGVVGLGFVGLTLATVLAEVGHRVLGIERREEVVELTNKGVPHFSEAGLPAALSRVVNSGGLLARTKLDPDVVCRTYIITVGTPLGPDGLARVDMIEAAAREVAANLTDGALVILRSTVKVGTTRNVVKPILDATGKKYDIAMCPERTLEGKALHELREVPQIVGADSVEVTERAATLFRRITGSVIAMQSYEAAEILKLVDNTYRDVQFAFANEVARVCDAFGVNATDVISAGKLGYPRTNVALPGLVGGPCLEKDPHILEQSAQARGIELEVTKAARLVNERQPDETVEFIDAELRRRGFPDDAPITVLGMAFKGVPATDDLRGSMSIRVLDALRRVRGSAPITLFDPVIEPASLAESFPGHGTAASLVEAVSGAAAVVIANNHPELGVTTPSALAELMLPDGFVYDYWNHFSKLGSAELSGAYFAVGNAGISA
jgi:UDP-N-acetyl-D-mannosaminuronic acid dehydrogenase